MDLEHYFSLVGTQVLKADTIECQNIVKITLRHCLSSFCRVLTHTKKALVSRGFRIWFAHSSQFKDRMNTEAAKQISQARHEFMEEYLREFYAEWEGKR